MKTILTLSLAVTIQSTVFSQITSFTGSVKNDRLDLTWSAPPEKM